MVFQPHRYTHPDLYEDFADVLSKVSVLVMLEVYAAGEPIPGADGRALCAPSVPAAAWSHLCRDAGRCASGAGRAGG